MRRSARPICAPGPTSSRPSTPAWPFAISGGARVPLPPPPTPAMPVGERGRPTSPRLRDTPAFTRDGAKITLLMNAGLAIDLDILRETGAEGIGLFRTEFQFMVAEELPRLNAQTQLYQRVLDVAGDMPVIFRTLDLGGDKVLPYLEAEREDNPALGWRAIRMGLDRPALLRPARR